MGEEILEIPLKPISKTDIHRLEIALMLGTLLRPDVLEKMKDPEERLTWIDSLGVAAAAFARERAGMPVSRIADEIGRTETTIRRHLLGKTEAGQLVKETYEKFAKEGVKIELPSELVKGTDVEKLKAELEAERRKTAELSKKLDKIRKKINEILEVLG